jgi:hypothetical protein
MTTVADVLRVTERIGAGAAGERLRELPRTISYFWLSKIDWFVERCGLDAHVRFRSGQPVSATAKNAIAIRTAAIWKNRAS